MMRCEIKKYWNDELLFAIETDSWKLAVEAAVKSSASLRGANLQSAVLLGANFLRANLQEANLRGVDFQGAISEAIATIVTGEML